MNASIIKRYTCRVINAHELNPKSSIIDGILKIQSLIDILAAEFGDYSDFVNGVISSSKSLKLFSLDNCHRCAPPVNLTHKIAALNLSSSILDNPAEVVGCAYNLAREEEDVVELSIYDDKALFPDNEHCNSSHTYETTSNDCYSVSVSVDCSVTNRRVDSVSDPLLFSNSVIYYECFSDHVSTLDF